MKVSQALGCLGVSFDSTLASSEALLVAKKAFLRAALASHPDKGGEPAAFQAAQDAWSCLRAAVDLGADLVKDADFDPEKASKKRSYRKTCPSHTFFENLPPVAPYKVEVAPSDRSKCVKTGAFIAKGSLRVVSFVDELGSYGRPVCLSAFRTPYIVQLGLRETDLADPGAVEAALDGMAELSIAGFEALGAADRRTFAAHVSDKASWAKTAPKVAAAKEAAAKEAEQAKDAAAAIETTAGAKAAECALVDPSKCLPVPGADGVADALRGKTFVLTGIFGGVGLNGGKDVASDLVKRFGGRVTGSLSKKTDYLLVGEEPGLSKVSKARALPNCELIKLETLVEGLRSGQVEELAAATPVEIQDFSRGFQGNSLKYSADAETLAIAAGKAPLAIKEKKRIADNDADAVGTSGLATKVPRTDSGN